ncbi:MAG: hypothetical protein EA362_10990 [Saprospirales bacterium]|nr:MAG: hypothetical protein EA362_10990 [Saprospirales bacterium]
MGIVLLLVEELSKNGQHYLGMYKKSEIKNRLVKSHPIDETRLIGVPFLAFPLAEHHGIVESILYEQHQQITF